LILKGIVHPLERIGWETIEFYYLWKLMLISNVLDDRVDMVQSSINNVQGQSAKDPSPKLVAKGFSN